MASQRKKGAILSYILMAIEVLFGFCFTPFLIRSFGQEEYGIYSLVGTVTTYLFLLDMGMGNAVVRYMAKFRVQKDEAKQKALLAVTLVFYFCVGILIVLVGILLVNNFDVIFAKGLHEAQIERAKIMLSITMLNAALTLMVAPFRKTIIAFERFSFSKIADIIKIILRVGISFIVLFMGGKGIAIVAVNFSMTICFGIVSIIYHFWKIKLKPVFGKIEQGFVKEILSYSIIVFIQMIATQLNDMADQVLMGMMVASSAGIIGVYAIGTHLVTYLKSFASGINGVLMPGVVRMVETTSKPKEMENEMVRIGRILLMMLGLIYVVFVVFGKDFICLWAGNENYRAYDVGVIIMLPMVLTLTQSVGSQVLWAKNRHKVQAVLQIIIALSNIGLTALLIQWEPLIGASIATALTYFAGNVVVQNIVYRKYIGISIKSFYKGLLKGILPAFLLSAVAGMLMKMLQLSGWMGFLINCGVMVLVFLIFMYFKGMTGYEKQLTDGFLFKIKMKKGSQ